MTDQTEVDDRAQDYEQYSDFIGQIELSRIWLKSTKVTNSSGSTPPSGAVVDINSDGKWKPSEDGFTAFHRYAVTFRSEKKNLAKIEVEYGLDYISEREMNDAIFTIFEQNNLFLNSWPYLREYLGSTVARMLWQPFTLPALKFGER